MDAIATDKLTNNFDTLTAVDEVTLSVSRGDLFGLLGPNGAGKTTVNPLFDGVDRLRSSFLGISTFPVTLDFLILTVFCCFMVILGAFLFSFLDVN